MLPEALHTVLGCFDGVFGAGLPGTSVDPLEAMFRDRVEDEDAGPRLRLVLLRDNRELPAIAARAEAAAELAIERGIPVTPLLAEGDSPLERFASLVALGDYASVYLALLEGVDPSDDGAMSELAARLPAHEYGGQHPRHRRCPCRQPRHRGEQVRRVRVHRLVVDAG